MRLGDVAQKNQTKYDNRLFTGKHRETESGQPAGRDPAFRRESELDRRQLGYGSGQWQQTGTGPQTWDFAP